MMAFKCYLYALATVFFLSQVSCSSPRWYAVEEYPAEQVAYVSDGVYVNGSYVRSARVTEIDGKKVKDNNNFRHPINTGMRLVKINCDEAKGSFNSKELLGQSKILKFSADIQRTYKAHCLPYTHWWIEDVENGKVVAGKSPDNS